MQGQDQEKGKIIPFVPTQEQVDAHERETNAHIELVQRELAALVGRIQARADRHDASKLYSPEAEGFMQLAEAQRLNEHAYGSPEYRANMRAHKPTILEHYRNNDHHPEHYGEAGITGMTLPALAEMFVDWWAGCQRHGELCDFGVSMWVNKERFMLGETLFLILWHTGVEAGYLPAGVHAMIDAHERCLEEGKCKEP